MKRIINVKEIATDLAEVTSENKRKRKIEMGRRSPKTRQKMARINPESQRSQKKKKRNNSRNSTTQEER